ncbi:MAG: TRAP transporter small permease [Paracoccaceae bacterium]
MRRILDALYLYSGVAAATFIGAIVAIVFAQVCLNLTDKIYAALVGSALGLTIPSYSDFTGFFLAAASFLALAYTLRSGEHIRVTLLTGLMPAKMQRGFEALALLIGLAMTAYATVYMYGLVGESIAFGDKSSGMVSIPIWLPQLPVLVGLAILTIALADELILVLRGKAPTYEGKGENLLGE